MGQKTQQNFLNIANTMPRDNSNKYIKFSPKDAPLSLSLSLLSTAAPKLVSQ
jgi:hypothetical protein